MAYDESLAAQVKEILSERSDVAERKMFGGLAFMLSGNMCCCVTDKGLMVRVGPDVYAEALALTTRRPDGPNRPADAGVGTGRSQRPDVAD